MALPLLLEDSQIAPFPPTERQRIGAAVIFAAVVSKAGVVEVLPTAASFSLLIPPRDCSWQSIKAIARDRQLHADFPSLHKSREAATADTRQVGQRGRGVILHVGLGCTRL